MSEGKGAGTTDDGGGSGSYDGDVESEGEGNTERARGYPRLVEKLEEVGEHLGEAGCAKLRRKFERCRRWIDRERLDVVFHAMVGLFGWGQCKRLCMSGSPLSVLVPVYRTAWVSLDIRGNRIKTTLSGSPEGVSRDKFPEGLWEDIASLAEMMDLHWVGYLSMSLYVKPRKST